MSFAALRPMRRTAPLGRLCRRALADRRGGASVMYGLLLPGMLGAAGVALDAVWWETARNRQQAATDQAAISAAQMLYRGADAAALTAAVKAHLAKLYGTEFAGLTVAVHNPPRSGPAVGDSGSIEVEVSQPQPLFFARIVHVDQVTVRTRAVSRYRHAEDFCLLALSPDADDAMTLSGSSATSLGCGIAANSLSDTAVYVSGSASVSATSVSAVGDILVKDSATLDAGDHPLQPHSLPIDDPYGPAGRNLQVPQFPTGCSQRNTKVNGDTALAPGRYCGGIQFTGGNVTLAPGTYIIDGGDFQATGNVSINGSGVTLVLTGSGNKYARLDVSGGTRLDLSAPTEDPMFKGVLAFQDPQSPATQGNNPIVNKLNGSADMRLSGALYFPSQALDFSGAADGHTSCLQLVAKQLSISGNSRITNVCDAASTGVEKIERSQIKLIE